MQAYAASLACPVGAIRLKVPDPLMKKVLEIFPAEVSTQSNNLNFSFSSSDNFLTSNICQGIFIFILFMTAPLKFIFHPQNLFVRLYIYLHTSSSSFVSFLFILISYSLFCSTLISSLCVVRFEAHTLFPFFKMLAERFIFFSTLYLLLRLIRRIFLE